MVPDQTQLRLKTFMIRSNCARNCLWWDPSALESAYDQTFQTKMTSDQTICRPWSDRSALELPKRPCNFGLGTHGCALDWVWSEVNLGLDLNLGWCPPEVLQKVFAISSGSPIALILREREREKGSYLRWRHIGRHFKQQSPTMDFFKWQNYKTKPLFLSVLKNLPISLSVN